jgi:hypothetical protein
LQKGWVQAMGPPLESQKALAWNLAVRWECRSAEQEYQAVHDQKEE